MARIALGISYNGAGYHGWQAQQAGVPSVQHEVETALSKVAAHPVRVTCAGRTDTGVHATGQVIHFDTTAARSGKAWIMGGNAQLPADVSVAWALDVPDEFDARHSATSRRYMYVIYNARVRSALMPAMMTQEHRPLDAARMQEAAQGLLGENDFSAFRAASCQSRTPMRNVQSIRVFRQHDLVVLDISANAFLHHMVRNIAGTLLEIGSGTRPVSWVDELMAGKDRNLAAKTAAPNGLYLVQVAYPDFATIPDTASMPHLLNSLDQPW